MAARLLSLIHFAGPTTRAGATAALSLPRSSAGEAVAELVDLGLITQGSAVRTTPSRGRPSPLLAPHPDGPVVAVAHLDARVIDLAVMGLNNVVVHRRQIPSPHRDASARETLDLVADAIRRALDDCGRPCAGVGVGLAGMVRATDGFVHSALYLDWVSVPAAEILAARLPGIPAVHVVKDASLAILAEHHRGAGRGAGTVLMLTCEHIGIGSAVLHDGRPFTGAGNALEAGHLTLTPTGPPCPCGQRGCMEIYTDGRALLAAAGHPDRENPTAIPEVFTRHAAGDPTATAAVTTTATHLTTALVGLTNLFSPDRIVLSGLLATLFRAAPTLIRQGLRTSVVARAHAPEVVAGTVPGPVLVGASERAFSALLTNPRLLADR
ncbi:ROK family protein [Actinosynnema sp. NPDC020468]|uniref:ROK family protein n=1 Tax=Actinosynnema sp. NPDC020468 TaxID=3154488 RepID=UPI0033CA9700